MDIHGCKVCFGGRSSRDCPCVQQDGMAAIYPAVKASDVVVLAKMCIRDRFQRSCTLNGMMAGAICS